MKKHMVFTLIHPPNVEPILNVEKSVYCSPQHLYLMPENGPDLPTMCRSVYAAEKDRSEWIRKYQNVLDGLNYWKERALSK